MTPGLGCTLLRTDMEPPQRRFIHDVARAPTVRIGMAKRLVIGYVRGQVQHARQECATGCSLSFGNMKREQSARRWSVTVGMNHTRMIRIISNSR